MRELRPHQEKAVEMLRDSLKRGLHRPMLAAPCSFGKTTVASHLFKTALEKGKRPMFIVDRVELIEQASERFDQDGIDHGIIQGDHWRTDYRKPVQIATIQTLGRRRSVHFDFAIIDEAHTLYDAHKNYMDKYNAVPFIGLSATPYTKGLGKHFNNLLVPSTTAELMSQGYLCDYECYAPSEPDLKAVRIKRGDYDQSDLAQAADKPKLVGDIIKHHQKLAKGRPTVVFAVDIKHSKHICEEFQKIGVKAVHVDAYTDKDTRAFINEQFKAGLIDVLSCVAIFEKGWDAPIASCLIDAAPTKSVMRYVQRIGRILRTHESKDKSIVLDHAGNTERHGWVEDIVPTHLDDGEKAETFKKERNKKKQEPSKCPKCNYVKETFVCGKCGYRPESVRNVETLNSELEKKSKKKSFSREEKEAWYAMFLHYANDRGFKSGWAYHKTVEKCGAFLRSSADIEPTPPSDECLSYIKYLNIKRAKSNGITK